MKKVARKDYWLVYFTGGLILLLLGMLSLSIHHPKLQPFLFVTVLSYSFISGLRFAFYVAGGFLFKLQKKKSVDSNFSTQKKVSIILPAYNEAQVIRRVLKDFEKVNYPNFEIILVDDGSQDNTFEVASDSAATSPLDIRVYRKTNGGKAVALNYGIERSEGEFVLCMDADSLLAPDSIQEGLKHFNSDKQLAAVAGVVCAENTGTLLGQFQQLDYLIGHFQRKILSLFGKVSIIPGPIGLFRKKAILSVGGYEKDKGTFAEDTELTFRLISAGWKVKCEDNMVALTEAPDNVPDLLRQRYRWSRGVYQALLKNLDGFIRSQSPSNLLFLMFLIWEQILVPIFDFALITVFICHFIFSYEMGGYSTLILYIMALDLLLALFSVSHEKNFLKWMTVALISRFSYVNVLLVWKLFSFYDEWKDVGMGWDKLNRKGFSQSEAAS